MQPIKLDNSQKRGHQAGGFGIEILYPGEALGGDNGDSGIGAIGRIDHATIGAGTVVRMHAHKDDEILSYMRSGTMLHLDNMGNEETVTSQRMMLMNAGHTFQHEEKMLEPVSMLQIFLRPRAPNLEPMVQFHSLDDVLSNGKWRMLAGPEGAAPLEVRAQAWVQDMQLTDGQSTALPPPPAADVTRLLYAFDHYHNDLVMYQMREL